MTKVTAVTPPPPPGSVWAAIERHRIALGWTARRLSREAGLKSESHYSVIAIRKNWNVDLETVNKFISALVRAGIDPAEFSAAHGAALATVPARVKEPSLAAERQGSLARVREELYRRYPKRAVDEAIGSSEFIGATTVDLLEAYAFFDDVLRDQRNASKLSPDEFQVSSGDADPPESEPPYIAEEDDRGRVTFSSLPPEQPLSERGSPRPQDEEHGGKRGGSSSKLPRTRKASR